VGGTLAGNALSMAAARTTLDKVLTQHAFEQMISQGERFRTSVHEVIHTRHLPWHVVRLGARVEYRYCPNPPRNGGESWASHDAELDSYLHSYLINRGVLTSPFHNMALMSPATRQSDIDRHTQVLADAVDDLLDAD
jgi:glutamate-1-semialdehyde 2,1-aminomutase